MTGNKWDLDDQDNLIYRFNHVSGHSNILVDLISIFFID